MNHAITDDGRPNIEVQSGPLELQTDFVLCAPGGYARVWQEYWLPVSGIKSHLHTNRGFSAGFAITETGTAFYFYSYGTHDAITATAHGGAAHEQATFRDIVPGRVVNIVLPEKLADPRACACASRTREATTCSATTRPAGGLGRRKAGDGGRRAGRRGRGVAGRKGFLSGRTGRDPGRTGRVPAGPGVDPALCAGPHGVGTPVPGPGAPVPRRPDSAAGPGPESKKRRRALLSGARPGGLCGLDRGPVPFRARERPTRPSVCRPRRNWWSCDERSGLSEAVAGSQELSTEDGHLATDLAHEVLLERYLILSRRLGRAADHEQAREA